MSERTDKLEAVFHAAAELSSAAERVNYLDAACQGNPTLRREVEALLKAVPVAEDMFQSCERARSPDANDQALADAGLIGSSVGPYKLLEIIGEGGMGVVYMAEQEQPVRRKVALKIIKLGMDTRQVVARFEAERQALAMMDNPHIAQVLGAGATETGRPYFLMELVQGVPITQFCDASALSIEERLRLFVPVCHAIQSAHQKGIIHRDLKPSNVLVTMHNGAPHPMIIDFGVAKAINQKLTEKTLFTHFGAMIGTPAYMSPEQAEMSKLDVDTRSDIYSLGVLLYELLTGSTPFPEERLRSVAFGEMQRIIVEEEPERPSTCLRKKAVGKSKVRNPKSEIDSDLDWIVMKCLEKDRTRRYETASGLAADIQRHLTNEPVVARPPSRLYEFQKTVRRHKVGFAATAAVILALAGGVAVSSWQAVRATRAERDALAVKDFLIAQLLAANLFMETAGDTGRQQLLERVAEAAGTRFTNQPLIEAEVRMAVGEAFYGIDEGDNAALEQFQKALVIRRRLREPTHSDTLWTIACTAQAHQALRHMDEAEKVLAEALAYVEAQGEPRSIGEAAVLETQGGFLFRAGRAAEAISYFDRSLPVLERLMDHKSWRFQNILGWRIWANMRAGKTNEAEAMSLAGIRQAQDHFGTNHPVTANFYDTRAALLHETGRPLEAAKVMEQHVLPVFRRGFGTNHSRTLQAEFGLARGLEKAGELEGTINCYSNLYERVSPKLPAYWARRQLGLMATFLTSQRRYDLARAVRGPLCKAYEANPPTNAEEFEWFIQAAATIKGWPAAAEVCRKHFDQFAGLPSNCRTMGTIFLYVNDDGWYRKVTTQAIALTPATTNWGQQLAILHIAARGSFPFSPEQKTLCEALIDSVERQLNSVSANEQVRAHRAIGALQIRLGQLKQSLAHLEKASGREAQEAGRARTLAVKALCLHKLGSINEARVAFAESEQITRKLLPEPLGERENFLDDAGRYDLLLRRELNALLNGAAPAP